MNPSSGTVPHRSHPPTEAGEAHALAFEHASIGIALVDGDGRVLHANPAFSRILRRPPEDLVERPLAELLPGLADAPEVEGCAELALPDEPSAWVQVCRTPVPGARQVVEVRDVTEQRRQEAERRRIDESLRQSQRLESVGRLAGGVAHDYNNLLSVILNYTDFARNRMQGDARGSEYLGAVRKAALRAAGLTRQLMIFGRRDTVSSQRLDLNAIIRELAPMIERTCGDEIRVELSLEVGLPGVDLALSHAEQVVVNLAVNARHAMRRGGRLAISTCRCGAAPGLPDGEYVQLEVLDEGEGMTPEVLALAFEPFFTTKDPGEGTGLGLSIVHGIVEEAGGRVFLESQTGEGTRVRVLLPARAGGELVAPQPKSDAVDLRGRGERVLVVEDETAVRALTVKILKDAGYDAIQADTPHDALARCGDPAEHIDLLLADVVMPKMSGVDLASYVRVLRPSVRVLLMSGHPDGRSSAPRRTPLDQPVLQKPFDGPELLRAVRVSLEASEDEESGETTD